MILYFNLTKLRLMNFYQVMTNVQLFLSQEDLETLKLKDAAKVFDEKYKAFDAAVQPMRGDVDTKELNKLDERRDKALMGLYGHVRVFTGFPEEAKATAAQQLQAILLKYDKAPQTKPLREETAIVSNVVSDLEVADAKAKLTLIGADKWLDELKDANKKPPTTPVRSATWISWAKPRRSVSPSTMSIATWPTRSTHWPHSAAKRPINV